MTPDELANRIQGAKQTGSGYKAKCPAHEDGHASLTIGRGSDGKTLLRCFAGCETEDICRKIGIEITDLFEDRKISQPVTVGLLAASKRLPLSHLAALGLRDLVDGGVGIPYRDKNGVVRATKRRSAIAAKEGSYWQKGVPLMPYGLDRLADAIELDHLVLVEGESDCWTLWHHGIPALGIPGANTVRTLEVEHLADIKTVYVFHEPDKGGDAFVAGLDARFAEIGFKGKALEIRIDAKDPSELHQRDQEHFKEQFTAALGAARPIGAKQLEATGFQAVAQRMEGERIERLERAKKVLGFGVKFLDDALVGIFPNDLIVIGAKSGIGKTQLSTIIADHNIAAGKRVHYFALEAEEREIERRMKFRTLADYLFRNIFSEKQRERINYSDWYSGKLEDMTEHIDAGFQNDLMEKNKNLFTFYRTGKFDIDDMTRLFRAVQDQTDLIILDHLHYVDTDDKDENRSVKEIVKSLRDISISVGKPVIVVAHLRKGERNSKSILPDMDDFHGSSDITKIATKCIMLAPDRHKKSAGGLWPTFMYAPKCRMDGGRTRYAASLCFNSRTGTYEDAYELAWMIPGMEDFKPITLPSWVK